MARKNDPNPYGTAELKTKIIEILWVSKYVNKCLYYCYPDLCKGAGPDLVAQVKSFAGSPLPPPRKHQRPTELDQPSTPQAGRRP